jgi:hypothetical protein
MQPGVIARVLTSLGLLCCLVVAAPAEADDSAGERFWATNRPATNVSAISATFGADLAARALPANYWWEYTTGQSYTYDPDRNWSPPCSLSDILCLRTPQRRIAAGGPTSVSETVALRPETTYWVRLCGREIGAQIRCAMPVATVQTPASPPPLSAPLVNLDFETGFAGWSQHCLAGRITRVISPVSLGSYSGRFDVEPADVDPVTGYRGRCELSGPQFPNERELWVRDAIRWPAGYHATVPGEWHTNSQWHGSGGRGNAVLALLAMGNPISSVRYSHGSGNYDYWRASDNGITIQPDRWYTFVWHIRFSMNPAVGYVEMWVDGVRQTMTGGGERRYGPTASPCYPPNPATCPSSIIYPKLGIYRSSGRAYSNVVWHDHFQVGDTAASVGVSP